LGRIINIDISPNRVKCIIRREEKSYKKYKNIFIGMKLDQHQV